MNRINERIFLILSLAPPCILGILTGLANRSKIVGVLKELKRPPLTMPIFFIVIFWMGLYVLLGLATVFIFQSRLYQEEKLNALIVSYGQLVMHSIWILVFFRLRFYGLAFLIQVLFVCLVAINALLFYRIDKRAGLMLIPYFLFAFYHTYLNLVCIFIN